HTVLDCRAGAVAPHDPVHFSATDVQVQAVERLGVSECLVQAVGFYRQITVHTAIIAPGGRPAMRLAVAADPDTGDKTRRAHALSTPHKRVGPQRTATPHVVDTSFTGLRALLLRRGFRRRYLRCASTRRHVARQAR